MPIRFHLHRLPAKDHTPAICASAWVGGYRPLASALSRSTAIFLVLFRPPHSPSLAEFPGSHCWLMVRCNRASGQSFLNVRAGYPVFRSALQAAAGVPSRAAACR